MRRLYALILTLTALLFAFGCSDQSPQPTQSQVDHSIQLVERPEFVETRPRT